MAARTLKIRKIIFGIRFKFSLIIILAMLFASILIVSALLNQHEIKIRDSMQRYGTTILDGISDQVKTYLFTRHARISAPENSLSPREEAELARLQKDAIKKISGYFASVVGKEAIKDKIEDRILDIAFLVDADRMRPELSWKRADRSYYLYFNRLTGEPFIQKSGRHDPLLEPTIVSHYIKNIDTSAYIGFASASDVREQFRYLFKNKPDYVIAGIPILQGNSALYDRYNEFKRASLSQATLHKYIQDKKALPRMFTSRIIQQGANLEYLVNLESNRNRWILFNFLWRKSKTRGIAPQRINAIKNEFYSMIGSNSTSGRTSILRIQSYWGAIQKKYAILMSLKKSGEKVWQECYFYLERWRVPLFPAMPLDDLARISFRNDLAGILGLFLHRRYYFPEMVKSQHEIINLMLSILIRAIFLALLLPTFIIRSITRLADGAVDVGKGNLNKIIEIPGSDEIGRLADIFNVMTSNLKKAEEMKIEKIRMERELLTAQQIQSALLPKQFPDIKGIAFGAYYSAQTESGGDYYDCIDLGGGKLGITIADVSGHGVGSGLVMAMTRTLLHTYCSKTASTKKVLEAINEYLKTNTASNYFVTMFYGILNLETLKMTYSSAGHCLPIIIRDGKIRQLPAGGIALGVVSSDMFSGLIDVKEVQLQKGDYFVQYTDGVDEAMDSRRKEFGLDRFHKSLLTYSGKSPSDMVQAIVKEIDAFTGNLPQHDDITMLILRIT